MPGARPPSSAHHPVPRRATFMALPIELYSEILGHVTDSSTHYALLFVSKVLHQEALRHLYHTIESGPMRAKFVNALETITSNPHIASFIHALAVSQLPDNDMYRLCTILPGVYPLLKNLKVLRITDVRSQACYPAVDAPFQLQSLTIYDPYLSQSWLTAFLEGQHDVDELILYGCPGERLLSGRVLPQLKIVGGSIEAVSKFLLGQCITHLETRTDGLLRLNSETQDEINCPQLRSLRLINGTIAPFVKSCSKSLECLEIPLFTPGPEHVRILLETVFEYRNLMFRLLGRFAIFCEAAGQFAEA